jgi:hypothetical protein
MSCCEPKSNNCCESATQNEKPRAVVVRRPVEVEFLYLDRTICERCKGTEAVIKDAVEEAQRIMSPTGVDVSLKMTHVRSEVEARALAFVSSPTIRVMGRDAAVDVKETSCAGCGELGGGDITCRVWTWQGKEYSVPPKAMLLDAILRDAYLHPSGGKVLPEPLETLPENMKKFFEGVRARAGK